MRQFLFYRGIWIRCASERQSESAFLRFQGSALRAEERKLNMEKINFTFSDSSGTVEFFVLEQTMINGVQYILVTDSEEDEAEAYILKDLSKQDEDEALYVMVEDDEELKAVSAVFDELLDEIELK